LWHGDGFNYLRAKLSIIVYRLQERIFIKGREEVYKETTSLIGLLLDLLDIPHLPIHISNGYMELLIQKFLPSAPFSLAARSALDAFIPQQVTQQNSFSVLKNTIRSRLTAATQAKGIDWTKP
jgi:hypothetical protein